MAPKKDSGKSGEKKRRVITIEMKKEIIELHDGGMKVIDLAKKFDRSTSTICTILKQKDNLKEVKLAKGTTILSKFRSSIHEEMEDLLLLWIKDKELAGDTITQTVICEKARHIFEDLQLKHPTTSTSTEAPEFKGSHGWFANFKKRTGIHSVVRHGEASSADVKAAEDYVKRFAEIIAKENYIPQQVFNCDETGLFWKKMPRRTFITAEEKKLPGHKPMKDRLTLALCANASGDCKVKPLLVYHAENPRAFKTHKITKENLQVMWRSNPRAWVTRQFFTEWVNVAFGPQVKAYLQQHNLPLKALLVLDNAPAHPPGLEEDIEDEFKFIKVLYLPPNTTSILQPMDQQVIANFKKLYTKHLFRRCFEITENTELTLREFWKDHYNIVVCLRMIDMVWREVSGRTLNSAWKQLWPEVVLQKNFEGFEPEEKETEIIEEIVSIGKTMGLQVDEEDVNELVREHEEELSTEELVELNAMQQSEMLQEISSEEEEEKLEVLTTSEIKEMLSMWEKVAGIVEKCHPEKSSTGRAIGLFNDTCLTHFRSIIKSRQKQSSLDKFLQKRPSDGGESSKAKKFKPSDD